jgi:hypothetical protein
MSSIGGPGGIGGPKPPAGPRDLDEVAGLDAPAADAPVAAAAQPGPLTPLDAIAADLTAGRLSAREAVDRLVDQIAGAQDLAAGERAELREMMQDLIANDPYLQSLMRGT